VVQVGAVSEACAAVSARLSQQFGVPGRVEQNGAVWRIQMGPFASKSQAPPCSSVCKMKRNCSHLSLLRNK
jgi:cell division protein FtsN